MDDQQWYERILRSIDDPSLGLPGFPSVYQQEVFVGKSNEVALAEAFTFYKIVKAGSYPLRSNSRVLDFGVGWGRIIRFFLNDVDPSNLYGVDVDEAILDVARSTGVPGNLSCVGSNARLAHNDGVFDVIYAFSVFSHLSEASAKFWLPELMRVLAPGGTLVMTTTTDHFLELCQACALKQSDRNRYEEDYAGMFPDPADARRRYAAGKYVYAAVAGNADVLDASNYGWAAMPPAFVEREIGSLAQTIEFVDDPSLLPQGFFTVRKKASVAQRIRRKLRTLAPS
ncbi:class I SAM-dependent methyltransferase [Xanthomonas sp. 3058]|uniref:class I SAM-dependent methyltransferase n=1 Tax=Xanthomonas sp. 3058 TaxID=3035314 RepID=UPI00161BECDB|nr:class I SAM-dependent methyltransferase [Xanthomonas sp. 3058]MBB5864295.1 ubiquinone/menaquinone biosynthesis C-methylase UbiE [Xanthomonas sp. 3058]